MTANLLTLNSSKIEFLLIGLKQLAKLHYCSLSRPTINSARNFGFIFDVTLSGQISAVSEYKRLSFTYKALTTIQPAHIYNLVCVQPPLSTRSASVVTLT